MCNGCGSLTHDIFTWVRRTLLHMCAYAYAFAASLINWPQVCHKYLRLFTVSVGLSFIFRSICLTLSGVARCGGLSRAHEFHSWRAYTVFHASGMDPAHTEHSYGGQVVARKNGYWTRLLAWKCMPNIDIKISRNATATKIVYMHIWRIYILLVLNVWILNIRQSQNRNIGKFGAKRTIYRASDIILMIREVFVNEIKENANKYHTNTNKHANTQISPKTIRYTFACSICDPLPEWYAIFRQNMNVK